MADCYGIFYRERIWACFEYEPSGVNIADLLTRLVHPVIPVGAEWDFGFLSTLKRWVTDFVAKEALTICGAQ